MRSNRNQRGSSGKPRPVVISILKQLASLGIICLMTFLVLEILLRIYHPIPFRVKGDSLLLEANRTYRFEVPQKTPKLDSVIVHRKNSIGFRGPDPPADFENYTSIIAVGGSTTECLYLSEGKDWPSLLAKHLEDHLPNLWINNAGFDGHTSRGHQILLEDYILKLKPDMVLFLVGINDLINRSVLGREIQPFKRHYYPNIKSFLSRNSEVISTISNLWRSRRASQAGIGHRIIDFTELDSVSVSPETIESAKHTLRTQYLDAYRNRLLALVEICRRHHITPVFITQPCLAGTSRDPATGRNLEHIQFPSSSVQSLQNGRMAWELLELYNQVTLEVGTSQSVQVIDLARLLPKNSQYFYDFFHFSNAGSKAVAQLIAAELLEYRGTTGSIAP